MKPYFETELGKLYCGDCLKILPQIPDKSIDLVLTDPPYGLSYRSNRGAKTGNLKDYIENDRIVEYKNLLVSIRENLEKLMAKDSEAYIFCSGGGGECVLAYAWLEYKKSNVFKIKNLLVWDKLFVGMGWNWRFQYETIFQLQCGCGLNNNMDGSNRSNVLRFENEIPQAGEHPTKKPIGLLYQILKPKPSQITLDPFLGSGTTAVACERLNRRWIGIEISEKYCKIAKQRLIAETQQRKLFK
jgi:DNA modification methylase